MTKIRGRILSVLSLVCAAAILLFGMPVMASADNQATLNLSLVDNNGNVVTSVKQGETFWAKLSLTGYTGLVGNMNTYDRTIAVVTAFINADTSVFSLANGGIITSPYSQLNTSGSAMFNTGNNKFGVVVETDGNAGFNFSIGASELNANGGELFRIKFTAAANATLGNYNFSLSSGGIGTANTSIALRGDGTDPNAVSRLALGVNTTNKAITVLTKQTNISTGSFAAIADVEYTGSARTPAVTITCNAVQLVENTDYTLSYTNNVNVGTATVTATGIGNYYGTLSTTFNIIEQSAAPGGISDWTYTISGNTVILTKYNGAATVVNVPATFNIGGVDYKTVFGTSTATTGPFCLNTSITQVNIADGVTFQAYGDHAFRGCTALRRVTGLPANKAYCYTFYGCTHLEEMPDIPFGVENIRCMFLGCTSLTTIGDIPVTVTGVINAFKNCTGLANQTVKLRNYNIADASGCFTGVNATITVHAYAGSTTYTSFKAIESSKIIVVPVGIDDWEYTISGGDLILTKYVGTYSDVYIPKQITIGDNTYTTVFGTSTKTTGPFCKNTTIKNVNFEYGIAFQGYGDYAFYQCTALESVVNLPRSTAYCYTFYGCTSLAEAPEISIVAENIRCMFLGCTSITELPELPTTLRSMVNTFKNCTSLKSQTLKVEGLYIEDASGAFDGFTSTITIQPYAGTLTETAFQAISNSRIIVDAIDVALWDYTLDDAANKVILTKYTGVIASVTVPSTMLINDKVYNVVIGSSNSATGPFVRNKIITSVTFENGVTFQTNANYLFYQCTKLLSATNLPDHRFYCYAFMNCTQLKSTPQLPPSIDNARGMFYNCCRLTTINALPTQITNMCYMFKLCYALPNTTINYSGTKVLSATGCFNDVTANITLNLTAGSSTYNAFKEIERSGLVINAV